MSPALPAQDDELARLHNWLSDRSRIADIGTAIRSAIDFVIDGGRTGRYSIEQLQTSEKIYIGNRVEHAILYELGLPKCAPLDTTIEGLPIDIKFSLAENWMIPPEAYTQRALCIVVSAQDAASVYRVGVFRALEPYLAEGGNRDGKKGITRDGKNQIRWVGKDAALPPNFLLHLGEQMRSTVLAESSGQAAVTQLFRLAIRIPVPRVAVETVARQLDPTKRVRDARLVLNKEGIDILSSRYDAHEIAKLGFTKFPHGSFVSIRR